MAYCSVFEEMFNVKLIYTYKDFNNTTGATF